MEDSNRAARGYIRSWKTSLFAILAMQGFGLVFGAIFFGYVVTSQPPSIYPVFGYGKPPPIMIDGFSSYYWAIPGAIIGLFFTFLAMSYRQPIMATPKPMAQPAGTIQRTTDEQN